MREHGTALVAILILAEQLRLNPSLMARHELQQRDFQNFRANIESTYFIRIFAEFESALRDVWNSLGRNTQPRMTDLLDGLTSRSGVPGAALLNAHRVRQYRNTLVHEESLDANPVTFADATRYMLQFLSYMPPDW